MIKAAGILFVTPDQKALFLKRGDGGDHAGEWACPGGKHEDAESLLETAIRETVEETGLEIKPEAVRPHCRSIAIAETGPSAMPVPADPTSPLSGSAGTEVAERIDFTTFICRVKAPFMPILCDESTGWAWADVSAPPEPLHPGVRLALSRLSMDELGVARAMAEGLLTSPQIYETVTLFAIRITGTGIAYRRGRDEFVHRDPAVYLTEEFLARCNGLPVLMEHPEKSMLNSEEFADRVIGTILLPYIDGSEVWAIAKIYDAAAIDLMSDEDHPVSTSPGVAFRDPSVNVKMRLQDGSTLLVEGKPSLVDHIAIVPNGVWDKGRPPSGVALDSQPEPVKKNRLDLKKLRQIDHGLTLLNARLSNRTALAGR